MRRIGCGVLALTAACLVAAGWASGWPFGTRKIRICRMDGEPIMGALLILRRPGEPEADFVGRTNTSTGWLRIPRERIRSGAKMFLTAPACALVRGDLPWGFRVRLPDGVPVTLRVDGDFELPRRPARLRLYLKPGDAEAALERALAEAVAPPGYWRRPEMQRDRELYVDPVSRSARALLPRGGRWNVRWAVMVTERRGGGVTSFGSGPAEEIAVEIPEAGGTVVLAIDPAALAEHGKR